MGDSVRRLLPYRYYNATLGLILVNVAVFFVQLTSRGVTTQLALIPPAVADGRWWSLLTYQFVHSPGSMYHIIFNMLGLLWFGTPVERRLGSSEFLLFYLLSGVGAGIFAMITSLATPVAIIGASGAVFAVMLVFATLFPDAVIYLFWFVPLRAPIAVLVFAGLAVLGTLTRFQPGISHLTHIGGLLAAILYLVVRLRTNPFRVFFRR